MKVKNLSVDQPVRIKAGPADGLDEGQFSAYASVFGNVDSYGDVVVKGAFDADLKRWEASGNPIPLLYGHNMTDPEYIIGHVLSAVEDDRGLLVTAQLDQDVKRGRTTYGHLKGGRLNQMSFAYDVIDYTKGVKSADGTPATQLNELKLYEVSVVLIGANQETEVLAVKAAADALESQVETGVEISADDITSLRSAWEAIGAVLTTLEGDDEEPTSEASPEKDEEPVAPAKSDEPSLKSPVRRLSATAHIYALTSAEGDSR